MNAKPSFKLRLRSYDSADLDSTIKLLQAVGKNSGVVVSNAVFLPKKCVSVCVQKCTFVKSYSQEHLGFVTHSRLVYLTLGDNSNLSGILNINVPASVEIKLEEL